MAAVVRLSAFPSSTRFALSSLSSKFFASLSGTPSFSAPPYHTSSPASLLSSPTSTNVSAPRFISSSSSPPSPPSDLDSSRTDIYNWSKHSGAELNGVVSRELKALCWRYLNQIDPAAVGVAGSGGSEGGEVAAEQIRDSVIDDNKGILEDLVMKGNRKWDCLDTVEFLLDVENLFRITIPDEVADEIKSIQEVQDFVVKALTEQQQQTTTPS
eukprot:GHVS01069813.1.p1 GENE.GHVS01069813.1~~GHVS01069813.1.p1  ORF type:complete len:232 (+),score=66.78 GHVS01069813.1:60-698(+)